MKNKFFWATSIIFIAACSFDTSGLDNNNSSCGDNVINGSEECEGNDLDGEDCISLGFYGGSLSCSSDCTFNTSLCTGTCGDSIINGSEECDGVDIANHTCADEGFNAGIVTCNTDCTFDISDCHGEAVCGDGILQSGEECDEVDFGDSTCLTLGFYGGVLGCNNDCTLNISDCQANGYCGDSTVQTQREDCDGTSLSNTTCISLGFYGGNLLCSDECSFNTTDCEAQGMCGDGIIQDGHGEICDLENFGSHTCADYNYYEGTPLCVGCTEVNTSPCIGRCGDNIVQTNYGEVCDVLNLNNRYCRNEGFFNGTLSCESNCSSYISSSCLPLTELNLLQENWGRDIIMDDAGNIFITGRKRNLANSNWDGYVTKYDISGNPVFSNLIASSSDEMGYSVKKDSLGNIYVMGYSEGSIQTTGTKPGGSDIFLAKYDSAGNQLWIRLYGTAGYDTGRHMALDSAGNVILIGYTSVANSTGTDSNNDVIIIKTDSSGTELWKDTFGVANVDDLGLGVTVDHFDNIYIAGITYGNLEGQTKTGSYAGFVTKFLSTGAKQWTRILEFSSITGIDYASFIYSIDFNRVSGEIVVGGYTVYDYGTTNERNYVIQTLTTAGTLNNPIIHEINNSNEIFVEVHAADDGNIYATGSMSNELSGADYDGLKDVLIVKFDSALNHLWTRSFGGSGEDEGFAVSTAGGLNAGSVCVTGYSGSSNGDFSGYTTRNAFVACISED
ncbi:hypothetical protein KKF34_17745 [Myxococcota bacterium]|nr:hypothetical protein [Myxococcota bacterium]MBU1382183.1 hypothetical protein [Myxococcota bacterium]MBU1498727.1 hypothetical protein [Myxococcota bacterium]